MADEYDLDRPTLEAVIRAMEQDLVKLESALQKVRGSGNVTTADVGSWSAAVQLADVSGRAYAGTTTYGQQLVTGYKEVIGRLRTALKNYNEAERKATTRNGAAGAPIYG